MNKQDLQIFLGHKIIESKLSQLAKLQMLEFIQHEASTHQLMSLILDGKIVKLDEQAKQIVEDRFKTSPLITEAFEYYGAVKAASKACLRNMQVCKKAKCYKLSGYESRVCRLNCDISAYQQKIKDLKSLSARCNKARNPMKCRKRFEGQAARIQKLINSKKKKLIGLKTKKG